MSLPGRLVRILRLVLRLSVIAKDARSQPASGCFIAENCNCEKCEYELAFGIFVGPRLRTDPRTDPAEMGRRI